MACTSYRSRVANDDAADCELVGCRRATPFFIGGRKVPMKLRAAFPEGLIWLCAAEE